MSTTPYGAEARCTPAVDQAVADLRAQFGAENVEACPDGQGGAYVILTSVALGDVYVQEATWLGFHITHLHPAADVYPHYVRPDLVRRDGQALGVIR